MLAVASFKRWLFRLYGPEAAPIILTQRRVYVLPTGAGLTYAAALGLMLIGAINYNLSLGYALIFLLAGLGLVALLHTFRNLVQIEISPGRAEPVFAGDMAHFGLQLLNRRKQGRFAVSLNLAGGKPVSTDLAADAATAVNLPLPASRRGWLRPGRVTLQTRYPLCLVRAWSYVEPDMRCLVYPRPEASAPPLPLSATGESGGSARRARGLLACARTSPPTRRAMSPGRRWRADSPCSPSNSPAPAPFRSGSTGTNCRPTWTSKRACRA
jgi:uncharacterized protein (DUF58 family)